LSISLKSDFDGIGIGRQGVDFPENQFLGVEPAKLMLLPVQPIRQPERNGIGAIVLVAMADFIRHINPFDKHNLISLKIYRIETQ
jgi:hypothetical protein